MNRENLILEGRGIPVINIDNKVIAIVSIALLLLIFVLIFHTHEFTATTVPAVEVMQWSSDTSWVGGW